MQCSDTFSSYVHFAQGTVRHILSSGSYFRRVDNTDRRGVWRIYKDLNSSGGEKDHQQTGEEESSRQSDNETEYESGSRKCSRSSPAAADLVHVAGLFESTNEVLSQPFLFTTSTLHREQTPCDPFNGFARGEIDDLMLSGQPDTFSQSHFHPTNGDHQQSFTQGDIHLNRPALTEHSAYGYPAPFELYAPCYIATSDHHAQMMPFCPPPMPAPPLLDTNAHQGHAPFTALAHALCPDGVPSFWTENDGHAIMTAGLR